MSGSIMDQWMQGAGPSIFGSSTPMDLLSGLAGAGALATGNVALGLPLVFSALGGLGGGQSSGMTSASPALPTGTQSPLQQINQIAPAAQSVMNAMGLNPQNRPQTATPQAQMPQPAPMGNRAQVNLAPQAPPPVQAAGASPDVTAGAGTMGGSAGTNPNLQIIKQMLGL